MSAISYDGKAIIPAPFIEIKNEALERPDGSILSRRKSIVVKGKIAADKGSPNSLGVFWTAAGYPPDETIDTNSRLASILEKQEALTALFSQQGKVFMIQPYDGSEPTVFNPRIKTVDFAEGKWFDTCDYTITMEVDESAIINAAAVEKYTEEWNIEFLDEIKKTYRLTRIVSATAKINYDETGTPLFTNAWEAARDFVLNYIGLGIKTQRMIAPGVLDATNLSAYNYIRSQHIGETEGTFSVNESWVCFDPNGQPPAVSEQNITLRYSLLENKTNVSIEGTVTGFEVKNNTTYAILSTRYENAVDKWDNYIFPSLKATAELYAGITLNPLIINRQVGLNPLSGTITYHYEYDNSPLPNTSGALTESITINNHNPGQIFAEIPIPGRPLGPILQNMETVTSRKRSISIDILMPPSTISYVSPAPNTDAIVIALAPVSSYGVFLQSDEESWTPKSGRYTRQSTYVWE